MPKDQIANKNLPLDDDEQVAAIQIVAFKLRDEEYGVNIFQVQDINGMSDITRVPFAASFIKGVINQRGSVLPVKIFFSEVFIMSAINIIMLAVFMIMCYLVGRY